MGVVNQEGTYLAIYRLDGHVMKPCNVYAANSVGWQGTTPGRRFLYNDLRGDFGVDPADVETGDSAESELNRAWDWDGEGRIWRGDQTKASAGAITCYRRTPTADARGGPVSSYGFADKAEFAFAAGAGWSWLSCQRLKYVGGANDTLYLSGYATDDDGTHGGTVARSQATAGTFLARYDDWHGAPRLVWRAALPYDHAGGGAIPKVAISAWDVAGERVFAGHLTGVYERGVPQPTGSGGETVRVLDAATGRLLAATLVPGDAVGGNANWVDMSHGVRAVRRGTGEYVVFVEDVVFHKVIVYRGEMEFP